MSNLGDIAQCPVSPPEIKPWYCQKYAKIDTKVF